MANHLPFVLLNLAGTWTDVTADVSQADPFKVVTTGSGVDNTPKPASVTLTFEDPTGRYRPQSPASPLYGIASRNTPMAVGSALAYEDFEDATLAFTINDGGSVTPWARSTTSPHAGGWCLKSGTTAAGGFSDAIITAPAGANAVIFWYRTDCDTSDRLEVYSAGTLRLQATGAGGTWTRLVVPFPDSVNSRSLAFRYTKDATITAGADAVYVDDIQFVNLRATVEVSSWEPDRTVGLNRSGKAHQWTDVTAEGLLRRLGTWTDPLQSSMTRALLGLTTANMLGLWTGEDGRNAGALSNLTAGGPAKVSTVTFGDDDSPTGGATSVRLVTGSRMSGRYLSGSATAWQVTFSFRLAAQPASATYQKLYEWTAGEFTWRVEVNQTTYQVVVTDGGGVIREQVPVLIGVTLPTTWTTMRLQASISGGTVTWSIGWYSDVLSAPGSITDTFSASTLGALGGWNVDAGTYLDGAHFAYIVGLSTLADNLWSTQMIQSFNGYIGETAGARFARLMGESGLSGRVRGSSSTTEPMGPQRPDTLLGLIREVRDTDGGIVYDTHYEIGITYRTRRSLYAQPVALALTFGVNVAPPLRPIIDDRDTRNYVTVEQRDGGSYTAIDSTSSMGTALPPVGVGTAKQTVDVNVADEDRLSQLAHWHLGIGTVPDARYLGVTVDLDANPELELQASALAIGERLTVASLDADLVDLMVVGKSDLQRNQKRRKITFACVPYRQYAVALYDSTTTRAGVRGSVTSGSYAAGATAITVTATEREQWSSTSAPYDLVIAGERIRVTAAAALSGGTQILTVTRGINGVSKVLPDQSPVRIHPAQQARYAI